MSDNSSNMTPDDTHWHTIVVDCLIDCFNRFFYFGSLCTRYCFDATGKCCQNAVLPRLTLTALKITKKPKLRHNCGINAPKMTNFPDFTGKLKIEVAGFEPVTFWSRTRRATKLRYTSTGANKGTRTLDLRFTKPLLYRLSYIGISDSI